VKARLIGLIAWAIEVPGLAVQRVRDPRGPGWAAVAAMISAAGGDKPRAVRDRAILWLLIGLGLRRAEVSSLDLVHFEGDRLWLVGKGRRQRETQTLPATVKKALAAWLALSPSARRTLRTSTLAHEGARSIPHRSTRPR
jgi:site-specific recombinase XerC